MVVKYIKKVGIYVIYVQYCLVLKIFPTFIADNVEYSVKDKN